MSYTPSNKIMTKCYYTPLSLENKPQKCYHPTVSRNVLSSFAQSSTELPNLHLSFRPSALCARAEKSPPAGDVPLNYSLFIIHYSLSNTAVWHATTAAVSVRNRLLPRLTGIKPAAKASATSCSLKSPSGPISTSTSLPRSISSRNKCFSSL